MTSLSSEEPFIPDLDIRVAESTRECKKHLESISNDI